LRRFSAGATHATHLPAGDAASAPEEQRIVAALVALRETTAKEVMTPRVDVVALPLPLRPEDVSRAVKESGHSRFPVYEEDLDNLEGVLYVKDMFRMGDGPTTEGMTRRLRKPFLVPEGAKVLDVMTRMRAGRHAFAVVVDEYGGVEGVLTIKDLVSELVGELRDEFDAEEDAPISRVDANRWLVDGACPVDDATAEIGVPIPEGDYVTVGGFLFDRFGRIPEEGDVLDQGGWEFRIAEMERRRISKVVVRAPSARVDEGTLDGPIGK
jgi:CBS domain containing-hemolysin-like protein